ncbi:Serine/threonine-protein phosphatase 6 regulatory subunit 3 [Hondaea fermentalgiana]|uniref:Serine/threonine-protein phosphatase 6 regulatory subunit 3 n=1 Tax=Hondaea fermentalgiana TaxID=2315210 RepID=A0A2R5GLA3_9STRA|nr:Serine/threonine-protein phosphatase 6 regulatory subunit 3 [Hondaea fermentalgiana]|eukprot:GBG29403.1 Serine/threonine-protein phosphatase 6 regulatory subunit 3 [Hondaea fermentalgiana]
MYSSGGLDSFSSGTFWSQAQGGAFFGSPVDDILARDDFTLEDILEEDTTIQETKAVNEKLVDFLKEPATLSRLLSYVACTDLKTFDALMREGVAPAKGPTMTLGSSESSGEGDSPADGASSPETSDTAKANASPGADDGEAKTSHGGDEVEDTGTKTMTDLGNERASARAEAAAAAAASLVAGDDDEEADDGTQDGVASQGEAAELREERLMRFPFIACEVICCNLTQIIEPLVNSADLLSKFFSLLDREPPLDSRLAGYFFKILMVLLRRAPEKVLWFSIYRNIDISDAGCEDGIKSIGWLMPKLLKHIDSYSVMCCFKSLLQVAADENALAEVEEDEEDDSSFPGYGQSMSSQTTKQIGDLDGRDECDEVERGALMRPVRSVWLGGNGAAQAVLKTLAASNNSDSHNNAAELLADMIHRAAMARLALQQTDAALGGVPEAQGRAPGAADTAGHAEGAAATAAGVEGTVAGGEGRLPTFSAFVLVDEGSGPNAETAMIESGVEWTLELCQELLKVALFSSESTKSQGNGNSGSTTPKEEGEEAEGELLLRTVERGSASVASLQVLTHLVSAFALERWSDPSPAMLAQTGDSHVTTMAKHGALPAELETILDRLDDLTACLLPEKHATLFAVSEQRALRVLGMHRLRIVELACMLVHTKYPAAISRVATSSVQPLNVCLDLFFQFEWNNCLHSVVERTLQFCLRGGVSEESIGFDTGSENSTQEEEREDSNLFLGARSGFPGGSGAADGKLEGNEAQERLRQSELMREQAAADAALVALQRHVFDSCKLIDRLLDAYRANRESVEETEGFWAALDEKRAGEVRGKVRSCGQRGYIGYCHRIVNTVAMVASSNRSDREVLAGRDEEGSEKPSWPALEATDSNKEWATLLEGEISDVNAVEQCLLGGMRPRTSSIPTSEGLGGDMEDFDGDLFLSAARGIQRGSGDDDDDDDDDFKAFGAFPNPDAGVAAGVSFEIDDDDDDSEEDEDGDGDGAEGFNPFGSADQTPSLSAGSVDPFGAHFGSNATESFPSNQQKYITSNSSSKANDDDDDDEFSALASGSDPFEDDDDKTNVRASDDNAFDPFSDPPKAPTADGSEKGNEDETLAAALDAKMSLSDQGNASSSPKGDDETPTWVPDFE